MDGGGHGLHGKDLAGHEGMDGRGVAAGTAVRWRGRQWRVRGQQSPWTAAAKAWRRITEGAGILNRDIFRDILS